jgi:hypothetical protein
MSRSVLKRVLPLRDHHAHICGGQAILPGGLQEEES